MKTVTTKLQRVIDIYDSKRIPLSTPIRQERQGIFPYYGASGIIDYIDDYIFNGRYLLIAEDGENLKSRKLPVAFFAEGKFWVNNHAHIVKGIDGKLLDEFLKYWFSCNDISGYITGTAQPKLSQSNLKEIKIDLLDYEGQKNVTRIIKNYDDLVDNNNKRIRILEEMAQTIYTEWFVNFRFPGHEDVKFVDCELGKIPEGWSVKTFEEFVEINPAYKVQGVEKPYFEMADININTLVIKNFSKTKKNNIGSKFMNRDTIFPRISPSLENGKGGYVLGLDENVVGLGSTEFIIFHGQENYEEYVYLLSRDKNFRDNAVKSMVGASGRQRVQSGCFESYRIVLPSNEIAGMFSKLVRPMFDMAYTYRDKNSYLADTRDLLIPKLISGEIDVSELDIAAEVVND